MEEKELIPKVKPKVTYDKLKFKYNELKMPPNIQQIKDKNKYMY